MLDSEEERRMHLILDRDRIPSCYKSSSQTMVDFEEAGLSGDDGGLDSEDECRMHLILDRDRIPSCHKSSPRLMMEFEEKEDNIRWRWRRISHESAFGS